MIRTVLVDDEEPARDRLRDMLAGIDDVEVIGEAADGEEAITRIAEARPDLVFLDIQMPGRSGMDVIAALEPPRPRVIFCTAYDQYAIDAFEHHAVDYLLKPLNRERLSKAVDRVRESITDRDLLRREVADASETQARLLAQSLPSSVSLDYSGVCRAARGVGGDYYDFLPIGERRIGIALADVSGKGLFAGLLMASLQARIQSIAPRHGEALEDLGREINQLMHSTTDTNRYASFFYGLYDDATRELCYINAGHNPPLLLRPRDGAAGGGPRTIRLETTGTVIGLIPDAEFRKDSIQLLPGDILLLYTDGVTETRNRQGEEFGEARFEDLVRRQVDRPASELRDAILEAVDRFRGDAPQHDDITLVVIKVV